MVKPTPNPPLGTNTPPTVLFTLIDGISTEDLLVNLTETLACAHALTCDFAFNLEGSRASNPVIVPAGGNDQLLLQGGRALRSAAKGCYQWRSLYRTHILGLRAFLALRHVVFHFLIFFQTFETGAGDC